MSVLEVCLRTKKTETSMLRHKLFILKTQGHYFTEYITFGDTYLNNRYT